jgi:hypothetical protein
VTFGKRDDVFWRSSMSGGRATLQLKQEIINRAQSGDMMAVAPEGYALCAQCLFEYKHYADLNIPQGLLKGTGFLAKFWQDTRRTATRYGKTPVLIAKQNFLPAIVLCPISFSLFPISPIITLHEWQAEVYPFERATNMIRRPTATGKSHVRRQQQAD